MNSVDVELLGEEMSATLELHANGECHILARLPDGTSAQSSGEDFFEALCDLRAILEVRGRRLLCAGARIDVYPSSMARQSTQGRRVYVLGGLPKGERPSIVDIFDPADAADVVSIEVQRNWYERWLAAPRGQVMYANSS